MCCYQALSTLPKTSRLGPGPWHYESLVSTTRRSLTRSPCFSPRLSPIATAVNHREVDFTLLSSLSLPLSPSSPYLLKRSFTFHGVHVLQVRAHGAGMHFTLLLHISAGSEPGARQDAECDAADSALAQHAHQNAATLQSAGRVRPPTASHPRHPTRNTDGFAKIVAVLLKCWRQQI